MRIPRTAPDREFLATRRWVWLNGALSHVVRLERPSKDTYEPDFAAPRSRWCQEEFGESCLSSEYAFDHNGLKNSRMNTEGIWAYVDGVWRFKHGTTAFVFKMRWWGDDQLDRA